MTIQEMLDAEAKQGAKPSAMELVAIHNLATFSLCNKLNETERLAPLGCL